MARLKTNYHLKEKGIIVNFFPILLILFIFLSMISCNKEEIVSIGVTADSGARITNSVNLDERTVDLTIQAPSLDNPQNVRILLPPGFNPTGSLTYPVIYMLHGHGGSYVDWCTETNIEELTTEIEALIVMPDGGGDGWYSNWYNNGAYGKPMWETFHLTELPQLLERNYKANGDYAICGLSMGGFGAISYAGRKPSMFKAAASFSGVLNLMDPSIEEPIVWGGKPDQISIYHAHDPISLAPALEGIAIYISYGDGQPGPLDNDDETTNLGLGEVEEWIKSLNDPFVERLNELGIEATIETGPGTHSWPYYQRGFQNALPIISNALGL